MSDLPLGSKLLAAGFLASGTLHGFDVVTSGLMLLRCLRYRHAPRPDDALPTERSLACKRSDTSETGRWRRA